MKCPECGNDLVFGGITINNLYICGYFCDCENSEYAEIIQDSRLSGTSFVIGTIDLLEELDKFIQSENENIFDTKRVLIKSGKECVQ